MVQMNPIVGDLTGNVHAMNQWLKEARRQQADMVVFPELAITGYPPEDLLLNPSFLQDTQKVLRQFVKQCRGLIVIVGFVEERKPTRVNPPAPLIVPSGSRHIFNAAAVIQDGVLVATCHKTVLPNYGVFDESRYFYPGQRALVCVLDGIRVGVNICEDIWYAEGPTSDQVHRGKAEFIVNINASPYHKGKRAVREKMLAGRARENRVMLSYTNMVGGQDEMVFDGNSILVDRQGHILSRAKAFEEDLLVADLEFQPISTDHERKAKKRVASHYSVKKVVAKRTYSPKEKRPIRPTAIMTLKPLEEIYLALVTGVRDYIRKNRFANVVIGMSGGIDSALTAVIATDALGAQRVTGVFMPSAFTSQESKDDVQLLMKALKCASLTIPIIGVWKKYLALLAPVFQQRPFDETEENLQARIRGNLLMALSNKFGSLVLTTGNKSEMSVGYATLYGDMAGGFAVIKDVSKMLVYDLARYRNHQSEKRHGQPVIPSRIIERSPSAELKPHQTDQDTLPPYEVLDLVLEAYVEENRSLQEITRLGVKSQTARHVMALVDRSEYKRRQAPLGIKITQRALGKDRRMPITNRYLKH